MLNLENSVLGTVTGKVGSKVYYNKNGKTLVKNLSDPSMPKQPLTAAQIAKREKFRALNKFL